MNVVETEKLEWTKDLPPVKDSLQVINAANRLFTNCYFLCNFAILFLMGNIIFCHTELTIYD